MKTEIYKGWLLEGSWGEGDDILYLSPNVNSYYDGEVLAEVLEELKGEPVSVRYHITSKEMSLDEATEDYIKKLYGKVDADVGHHYSEITGYLWTDEEINIGGHDLIEELHSFIGKYLILVVDIHPIELGSKK